MNSAAAGLVRMETEIEFNRARTRAYLSNENLDEIQVLDIAGPKRDAPELIDAIDVGVNPRGMATNAADTRLYVANIQSADVSVVDIAPGSPTENQVLRTIAARATDDIVGGRADGWEALIIGGRAPRGIVFSDAHNALFVSSIGPQTAHAKAWCSPVARSSTPPSRRSTRPPIPWWPTSRWRRCTPIVIRARIPS